MYRDISRYNDLVLAYKGKDIIDEGGDKVTVYSGEPLELWVEALVSTVKDFKASDITSQTGDVHLGIDYETGHLLDDESYKYIIYRDKEYSIVAYNHDEQDYARTLIKLKGNSLNLTFEV